MSLRSGEVNMRGFQVVNVSPHVPEERALKLPSEPIVKGVPKNQVTDSLMAE